MSGMSDMGSTSNGSMSMKMYFHGSIGTDMLWFESWMPTSAGATVGVVIGLFVLAIFERWLVAFRRACDDSWQRGIIGVALPSATGTYTPPTPYSTSLAPPNTSRRISTQKLGSPSPDLEDGQVASLSSSSTEEGRAPMYTPDSEKLEEGFLHLPRSVRKGMGRRWSRPFRWGVDGPRGFLQALQTLLHYLLMLVVMSFNIWWILGVVVGCGVGEMMFGRFGSGMSGGSH